MGIDVHGFNFLRYAKKFGGFERTLTIGRQGLHISENFVQRSLNLKHKYENSEYCESLLLKNFGATEVDSIDNSAFEHASIIFDLNQPLPATQSRYNTIIDGGCLEHIYNIPQALKNLSLLCQPGGQIIHMLPANNFNGHGFWQFSPELFFSLYSSGNGYKNTEVFIADLSQTKKWFKVIPPSNGKRINIHSDTELYVLIRTVLAGEEFSHNDVQQSDYIHQWTNSAQNIPAITKQGRIDQIKNKLKKVKFAYRFYSNHMRIRTSKASNLNPGLREIKLASILPG